MKGTRARKRLADLKKRQLRLDPGGEDELKALARSWLANPLHDILVRASDLAIGDGTRRVTGLELLGEIDAEVFLLEGEVTDRALDRMAMVSAYHRSPLGGYDQACILRSMKEPGVMNKDLAEEMHIDPAMVTKYLSLFDCTPDVQEAARAGKIGVTDWYAISRAPDQEKALRKALDGATRADLEREGRSQRNGHGNAGTATATSIKIIMDGLTVSVKGAAGISLETAIAKLPDAIRTLERAKKDGHDAKTFAALMKKKERGRVKPTKREETDDVRQETTTEQP